MALSTAYTQEQTFFAENATFTVCLTQIGFETKVEKSYYALMQPNVLNVCGPTGTAVCDTYTYSGISAGKNCSVNNCIWATAQVYPDLSATQPYSLSRKNWADEAQNADCQELTTPGTIVTQDTFMLGEYGNISNNPVVDIWMIDHNKALVNVNPGI